MGRASGSVWQQRLTENWNTCNTVTVLLWPLSLVYGALVGFRRRMFRWGWLTSHRFPVPVIVVGNVVAGGVGKTPVVISIARHWVAQTLRVGIVSRGYGRTTKICLEVLPNSPAHEVGDEPALIKRTLAEQYDVPVFVAVEREEAVRNLLQKYPEIQVILCDDGMQHYALHRDIEICVFDDRGTGNGFLLPAGPLREPWPRKVDLILNTGSQPVIQGFHSKRALAKRAYRSDGTGVDLTDLARSSTPLLAVAGIARPENFFTMLKDQGLQLQQTHALPDHYDFNSWTTPSVKGYTLICTLKDAVKLWQSRPDALAVGLDCVLEQEFLDALDRRLAPFLAASLSSNHGHSTT